ncbi:gluconokinase [Listeria aquatica]|uniref:Putative gluconate kinase n=1 Tax=Listeria aquatica FSL S10-1188 TaxID=1265818 RepID=W7B9Y0_9LIST|nr:gluconokinase [Listeria aquatica]EUJ16723.1 putative gluconate kinase [Listeria aquatica FSL S10-1188]
MSEFVMGVDIGTSSTKAVLFTEQGQVVNRCAISYQMKTDTRGKAELDPEQVFEAVCGAIRGVMLESKVDKNEILAVSFSAAMHSLILVDETGKPLTKCITWADGRSSGALKRMKQKFDLEALYQKTGTPIHAMSPFAKLCWLQETEPEKVKLAMRICGIKSYVLYRFFGEWVIDASLASGSGLFDPVTMEWEPLALNLVNIPEGKLPEVVSESHQLTGLSEASGEKLLLNVDTPFVIGANDGSLANLGIQALGESDVTVTVGTSGAVRKIGHSFLPDEHGRTFCYRLTDGYFVRGGAVNNGGKIVEWALEQLAPRAIRNERDYEKLMEQAGEIPLGAEGLLFLPYLLGERAPYWTDDIRGAFLGLSESHTRAHMVRAVVEGVTLNLYSVYQEIQAEGDVLYVTGGIAQQEFWCQLLADVFGHEVRVPHTVEGSSLGAAIIALEAFGKIQGFKLDAEPEITARFFPDPKRHERYLAWHAVFAEAAEALMASNRRIIEWLNEDE